MGLLLAAGATFALVAASSKKGSTTAQASSVDQLYQLAMANPSGDTAYYKDAVTRLMAAGRADLAGAVYNKAVASGANASELQSAINTAAQSYKPASSTFVATSSPAALEMPLAMKQQIETVIRAMGIDPATGAVVGSVNADAVNAATLLASQLEAQGFTAAAAQLRSYAKLAASVVAPTLPPAITPAVAAALDPQLAAMVQKALSMESDPKKLRQIADFIKGLPIASDPKVKLLIDQLEAKAAQAEMAQVAQNAAQNIEAILTTPGIVAPTAATKPPPTPATPALPTLAQLPGIISQIPNMPLPVPAQPVPQPAALPKSEKELAAAAMVANIKSVQGGSTASTAQIVAAKGKEDASLIERFQSLVGLKSDGMAGPGTFVAAAKAGACDLPYVVRWPKSATKTTVYQYRENLRSVASSMPATCKAQLEASAARERGQAGIVGALA